MKKLIVLLACILNLMCYVVEARIYTNSKYGYAIDIPDYFVDRDGMGIYDFRADGGDDYGGNNLACNREGIAIAIKSKSTDVDSIDDAAIQSKIDKNMTMSKKLGQKAKYFPCDVLPNHKAIGSCIGTEYDNFVYVVMGIEVVMHGRVVNVLMEGTLNNVKEIAQIMETFRCVKH